MPLAQRIAFALLSALLFFLSFPKIDLGWIAWGALVPLMLACRGARPAQGALVGFVCGVLGLGAVFSWVFEVPGFRYYHLALLGLYFGLYTGLWCVAVSFFGSRGKSFLLIGPASWVVLDYAKNHAGFLSLPWAVLAHTQHGNVPLLQAASVTGEYGVTFLIVLVNCSIVAFLRDRRPAPLVLGIALVLSIHLWGLSEVNTPVTARPVAIAVVQPNIQLRERDTAEGEQAYMARLEALTMQAAEAGPAVILWPETAVKDIARNRAVQEQVMSLSRRAGTPLIVGASEFRKFAAGDGEGNGVKVKGYNSAYHAAEGKIMPVPYRKQILVPFGEYLPLRDRFRWPSWLVREPVEILPGPGPTVFTLAGGLRVSPVICWENIFADYVRSVVNARTDVVAQLTNDVWFGRSSAAGQHNMASVLRAVENRTPFAVASNSGPSLIIDRFGRVRAAGGGPLEEGVVLAAVEPGSGGTFYSRHGDLFVLACAALVIVSLLVEAVAGGSRGSDRLGEI